MKFSSVYVTASSRAEALAIGKALVGERLAACANVLDGVASVYRWQGKIVEDAEAVLIVKTRAPRRPRHRADQSAPQLYGPLHRRMADRRRQPRLHALDRRRNGGARRAEKA